MTGKRPTRAPIVPERVRRIDGGFAFVPHRFLHDGFLATLSSDERSLYLFLVLAGDRHGVSFYGYERICSILELSLDRYIDARQRLVQKDLLAFDGVRFQILSLPPSPVAAPSQPLCSNDDLEDHDGATIRRILLRDIRGSRE